MINPGDKVLIALSGGPDSVALTHVLKNLQQELQIALCAAHLNHSLRGAESDEDERFVSELARALDIPIVSKKADVLKYKDQHKISVEMAARKIRYHFLEETARALQATKIATGHTADDQAEEVLMNLLRGAGPTGLSGIPPVRDKFIRPLIGCSKNELICYLDSINASYRTDSTNIDKRFLRNRLRHDIFPELHNINPRIIRTLSKTAQILRDEEDFWENYIKELSDKLLHLDKSRRTVTVDVGELLKLHLAVQRRVLRFTITRIVNRVWGIGFDRIQEILSMCSGNKNSGVVHLHGGIIAEKRYDKLFLYTHQETPAGFDLKIPAPGKYLVKKPLEAKIIVEIRTSFTQEFDKLKANEAVLDADKVYFPLKIRSFQHGDRFIPLGLGRSKKLQDFFVDEKVPRHIRPYVPILHDKEKIIWIIGYRIDDRVKITPETKRVIFISWDENNRTEPH